MFHSTISQTRRRRLLGVLFVCTLILSIVLGGATGSADKSANKDFVPGRIVSGRSPGTASRVRGSRPSQPSENLPSFFLTSMPRLNLPLAPGSTITVNSTAQSPGAVGDWVRHHRAQPADQRLEDRVKHEGFEGTRQKRATK